MINILIVDDTIKKIKNIKNALDEIIDNSEEVNIQIALEIAETKRIMSKKILI